MKILLHPADARGRADHGWLKTHHSFSFADWFEPSRMGFGALRVLNDDWIAPQQGFGMHPHNNFEIITLVMQGAVTHEDSMGNHKRVEAGEVQVMSAGTGVVHSEHNREDVPLELFQIWIETNRPSAEPRYDQRRFDEGGRMNRFQLLVSGSEEDGALMIYQDAKLSRANVRGGSELAYHIAPGHGAYLFVIEGEISVGETELHRRDALGIAASNTFLIRARETSDLLCIEVPISPREIDIHLAGD